MVVLGTRWKNRSSEAFALSNPMSRIVSELQFSLVQLKACGSLLQHTVDCVVLLEVEPKQADLLNQSFFGCRVVTTDEDKHQYELSLEEAFYLCHSLKCLEIVCKDKCYKTNDELWELMKSKKKLFSSFYKAYSHLRAKNWVVQSGITYGVDFVAYRHHPSLVHSEYAVMVLADNDNMNTRLMVWPSLHATVRLGDGVAKTLLILRIKNNASEIISSSCLEHYTIEEQTIVRWNSEENFKDCTTVDAGTENSYDCIYSRSSTHFHFNKFSLHQNFTLASPSLVMVRSNARWKGKGSKTIALANPMSQLITELQSSLVQSNSRGLLAGSAVLLEVALEQADLLNRACFGCPIITDDEDKRCFELNFEEAFYLCHSLNCIKIARNNQCILNHDELWEVMKSKREIFPIFYKAYSHLRVKNWVVRSGIQYGVDYVAYCHHPSLVHSEYAVTVSEGNDDRNRRLLAWPDVHATVRLEGGVAKTLLILHIKKSGYDTISSSCLKHYTVQEQTVTRWNSEQCREDKNSLKFGIK